MYIGMWIVDKQLRWLEESPLVTSSRQGWKISIFVPGNFSIPTYIYLQAISYLTSFRNKCIENHDEEATVISPNGMTEVENVIECELWRILLYIHCIYVEFRNISDTQELFQMSGSSTLICVVCASAVVDIVEHMKSLKHNEAYAVGKQNFYLKFCLQRKLSTKLSRVFSIPIRWPIFVLMFHRKTGSIGKSMRKRFSTVYATVNRKPKPRLTFMGWKTNRILSSGLAKRWTPLRNSLSLKVSSFIKRKFETLIQYCVVMF